ncbi:MAG: sigma-54-dependent Fis family transcriptional regulator [Geothrix sp.]|uniref:sigma 54-interacting transcriptional regulator n=1 Tax=Geothrix sp. TaxID=1962974 RepID=UPI001814A562|nr:sigma 54-interacting transcriptional regulator [Geothrix sp.]NWJ41414.1 sigma-54-dependent Fis family transcriptional regulator [Geothrix sp.]
MLRAAWLGDGKAPWGLDRGRRWGDPAWALAAISQAWLLGGREGRWPRLEQEARRPLGPRVVRIPATFEAHPDPAWVALLRHGSAGVAPALRGPREDELLAWAWEALLAGDGTPWMAAGSLLLDLPQRLRWVALLGAVDEAGTLHLPPYLDLIPAGWRSLPLGWWEFMLRSQDAEGRLLPEGPLDPGLPWPAIQRHAEPMLLSELPEDLVPHHDSSWLHPGPDGAWMLDPRLRAWARGFGASARGLEPLVPRNLGAGRPPEPALAGVLALQMPPDPPPGWAPSLEADLQEKVSRPEPPPASSHPTWDRLRMRWGGATAESTPGYPAWGTLAHPCADPFHWMAQGQEALRACEPEGALRAFTLAHAHFVRLGSPGWTSRAASNAAFMALQWADLPAHRRWAALRGPLPQPWHDHEAAQLAEVYLEPPAALARIRSLVETHPDFAPAWGLLAGHGLDGEQWDLVREALPHIGGHPYAQFLQAALGPLVEDPPGDADPETRVSWGAHRLFRGHGSSRAFWAAWRDCPAQVMRLELGLQVLERVPEERSALRLLALQAIADRADSNRHQRRLAALWPRHDTDQDPAPTLLFKDWLAKRETPTWIAWEEEGQVHSLGTGEAPPDGALSRLAKDGTLPPFLHGDWVWRGHPLIWEGCSVGAVLLAQPAERPPQPPLEPLLIAPWLARIRARRPAESIVESGLLWTDGSEPMASVLRELDRVAGSDLPGLILGPTGTGKELAATEVHRRSGRSGQLVAVNCSAFAEGLLESELFGHVKGAFTGADRDRRGAIEMARGGTLFLDEVADLSPRLQSLLLRVLQEREIRRVGSDHAVKVDVRFIAATHRPLEELAAVGSFRRDLLFRLQGAVLHLPPLLERRHEFPYLLPRLAIRAAQAARRPIPALAPGLPQALAKRPWPGNVRELLHALERAILRCEDGILKPGHFPELEGPGPKTRTWEDATRTFQRRLLLDTLQACGFRVADAAETLGLARPALYATAKRLGVDLVAERIAPSS